MHKKFIALIVATAVIVTGVSASQARAADAKDILGGLAAIALVGAALHQYKKDDDREEVTNHQNHTTNHIYHAPKHKPHKYNKHKHHKYKSHNVRSLPKHVKRYSLPQRCLRTYKGYSHKRPVFGQHCLNKHYKHVNSLPRQCKVGFWNGNKVKRAYEPACLRQKGYRVSYK